MRTFTSARMNTNSSSREYFGMFASVPHIFSAQCSSHHARIFFPLRRVAKKVLKIRGSVTLPIGMHMFRPSHPSTTAPLYTMSHSDTPPTACMYRSDTPQFACTMRGMVYRNDTPPARWHRCARSQAHGRILSLSAENISGIFSRIPDSTIG